MLKKHIVAGMASLLLCSGMTIGSPAAADAATTVNLDRNDVAYHQEMESQSKKWDFQYEPQEGIKVGYIITGDDDVLLDSTTMGYIRRVLHTKFPGYRYPVERIESAGGHFHMGRRNTGDTYVLTEAHDVQAMELEKLEELYNNNPNKYDKVIVESQNISGVNNGTAIYDQKTTSNIHRSETVREEIRDSSDYDFTKKLTSLPKDDYVRFARELEDEGLNSYDYLVMFNIKPIRSQIKEKFISQSRWTDFRLSVKAIDVKTGRYIERGEYHSRGYSGGVNYKILPWPIKIFVGDGPPWRKAMRRAIIDAMIESFDNMPIGKYSVCDNPYCARRQDEIRMEKVFGKNNRHCIKHCNDRTFCGDHMVSYKDDADLPHDYVNNEKEVLYTRE